MVYAIYNRLLFTFLAIHNAWACGGERLTARRLHFATTHHLQDLSVRNALQKALSIRAGSSTPPQTQSSNKKYTAAAASAMQTMNSLTSKNYRQPAIPSNLLSESALMDKETNAIYWQGGADIFSASLTKPYLTQRGVLHVKATILTIALWLWVWGKLSRYLAAKYFASSSSTGPSDDTHGQKLLFALPFISPDNAPKFLRQIASIITPIIQFILLLFHSILYLRLPPYSPRVLTVTILLYLLESFSCSTRRYLSHALNAPAEVESYLEKMRYAEPSVTWKVRCFHYEDREFWKNCKGVGKMWEGLMMRIWKEGGVDEVNGGAGVKGSKNNGVKDKTTILSTTNSDEAFVESPPSWMARKVVTHQAVGTYKFGSWEDHTLASIWKRSQSFSSTSQEAPFSKLTLSKLLLLRDKDAREDYFAQQAAFVMLEGRKDVHAEFATRIDLDGFRPKLLAVRPMRRASNISAALFRQHIYVIATLLGLSLPYRIWFAKHCDEIRVTVVKETSSASSSIKEGEATEGKSSWIRGKWSRGSSLSSATMDSKRAQELFRKSMQNFALYEEEPSPLDQSTVSKTAELAVVATDDAPFIETTTSENEKITDESVVNESIPQENTPGSETSRADVNVATLDPSLDAPLDTTLSTQPSQ